MADMYFVWYHVLCGGYNLELMHGLPRAKTTYTKRINHTLSTDLARWLHGEYESQTASVPYITNRIPFHSSRDISANEAKLRTFGIATSFISNTTSKCNHEHQIMTDFGVVYCGETDCAWKNAMCVHLQCGMPCYVSTVNGDNAKYLFVIECTQLFLSLFAY
eukprot:477459_1